MKMYSKADQKSQEPATCSKQASFYYSACFRFSQSLLTAILCYNDHHHFPGFCQLVHCNY
jgi:hypothetical protein